MFLCIRLDPAEREHGESAPGGSGLGDPGYFELSPMPAMKKRSCFRIHVQAETQHVPDMGGRKSN